MNFNAWMARKKAAGVSPTMREQEQVLDDLAAPFVVHFDTHNPASVQGDVCTPGELPFRREVTRELHARITEDAGGNRGTMLTTWPLP